MVFITFEWLGFAHKVPLAHKVGKNVKKYLVYVQSRMAGLCTIIRFLPKKFSLDLFSAQ
jgi:hypothetical protein